MKKNGTLNAQLSRIIAQMGHGDRLVICDSGLPIPRGSEIVDLALTKGIPGFIDTLKVVLEELQVEAAVVATELATANKVNHRALRQALESAGVTNVKDVPHDEFKAMTSGGGNIAFVRTGEATPYANVLLIGGVAFD
ncbi:MAG: D-ribose pyranase [Ignavibacteriales bacterium]|nr:D-ribose pyranase [Ignavibacteriales bacterium]